ncbi:MAG: hypothetical protein DMG23_06890 [Acidobacteria bacterium]|nr:MAG: hypothetical protein DMG23_06890 [Acidobacteriota bacterium]
MTTPLTRPGYVVDTSVAVKWYVEREEENVRHAQQLLENWGYGRCTLSAPELLIFELANALSCRRGVKLAQVLESLNHLRSLGLHLEALRWDTLAKALEIASSCGAAVYDSYFLAMALESNGILVTADQVFLRKVRRYPSVVSLSQLRLPD